MESKTERYTDCQEITYCITKNGNGTWDATATSDRDGLVAKLENLQSSVRAMDRIIDLVEDELGIWRSSYDEVSDAILKASTRERFGIRD